MKVALVYDRVNKIGGAERVLTALHQIWPEAPLFTSLYYPLKAPWAQDFQIIPSFLNRIAFLRDKHEYLANFMPYAFESFDFSDFDVVISVTSAEAKGIITQPNQLHLCYLLTPTKYLYQPELYHLNSIQKLLYAPLLKSLASWDKIAASRPDYYIAISRTVAGRCTKVYHREVESVIYPPVNCNFFAQVSKSQPNRAHYLLVSRLVPIKNTRLAIAAFRQLPQEKLMIVGTGSELPALRKVATPNVEFLGTVSDTQLNTLYHQAKALIFPQEEDFGITAVEAQAAGLPVIAYAQGGAGETVIDGKTGVLFHQNTVSDLVKAILKSQSITWYHQNIVQNARRFDQSVFTSAFKQKVESLWQLNQQKLRS